MSRTDSWLSLYLQGSNPQTALIHHCMSGSSALISSFVRKEHLIRTCFIRNTKFLGISAFLTYNQGNNDKNENRKYVTPKSRNSESCNFNLMAHNCVLILVLGKAEARGSQARPLQVLGQPPSSGGTFEYKFFFGGGEFFLAGLCKNQDSFKILGLLQTMCSSASFLAAENYQEPIQMKTEWQRQPPEQQPLSSFGTLRYSLLFSCFLGLKCL